ncbi:MAG: hypothetical protein K2H34_05030, partial [Lachnospiraceae bacterium]|nr:hypothetical protein [Lachnospiraceae bacterium]
LVLSLIIVAPLFTGNRAAVHAESYDFNPTKSGYVADSHGASKNGGAAYENCAYFTPTYFSKKGTVRAYVAGGNNVKTETVDLSYGSENTTYARYYTSTSNAGGTYYLYGKVTSISSGTSMRAKGRFTP